jgi:DNA polymerase III subunit beta
MKFIVSSSVLLKNLQIISGVLNNKNTLPILDNFLFELKKQKLLISSSDLETTMTAEVELTKSEGEEDGSICIPARILLETLKTMPDLPVSFNINLENQAIELSAGEGKYRLTGYEAEEYPRTPQLENTNSLEIHSSILANAIQKTLFATGNDDMRPVMSGVFCELNEENITFVSTDAHKLVKYIRKDAKAAEAASFVLAKKPLTQLKNILSISDCQVNINYTQSNISFVFDNIMLVSRLVEGKYPNYEAVIPKDNPNKLIVDRLGLLNAIRRVSIFANQSTHQVRFKITGQELVLSAEDVDYSNKADERMPCNYEGEDIEIGFNSKFIIEMLNNVDTEEVIVEMSTPNRAGIILANEKEEDANADEFLLMLVMPVMLNV